MKAIKGLEKSIQDLIIVFCLKGCERLLKGYWKGAERFALQTIQEYLPNIQANKRKAERLKGFSGNKIALYAREDSEDSEELIHGQIGKVKIMTARAVISRWNQWILDISGLFPTINETVRAMILPILR